MRRNVAPEANNLGRIFDLFLSLILFDVLVLHLDSGLVLVIGFESKSTFFIGVFFHSKSFFKEVTWALSSLISYTYMVSYNTSTRGSRCFIVRATRNRR